MTHFDTIAAPITGTQMAAVAIVRVSGPEAWQVGSRLFHPWPDQPESHRAYYGQFTHGDDGLCILFAEAHSYTGDQTVEFNVHGSPASVKSLLQMIYAEGLRPAEPGEFTQRAFLNGRMDLTRAEAVRDVIEANTQTQLRAAHRLQMGGLQKEIVAISDQLYGVLASVEASTDFAEEIGDLDVTAADQRLVPLESQLATLIESQHASRILREGLRIALIGPPNVGKSSLLNALAGFDRAIVTPIAGTTRDTIEEIIDLDGVACRFIDTAGLRDTTDIVESLGIERTLAAAQDADLVLHVHDLSAAQPLPKLAKNTRIVGTKADVGTDKTPETWVNTSAATGEGLDLLRQQIRAFANQVAPPDTLAIQSRHLPYLNQAYDRVQETRQALKSQVPDDLVSTLLRDAIHALGQVTGETASVDMVDRIFRDFCIGK